MSHCQPDRKHYYFTWGTLKQGFPNHAKYKEILGDRIGHFLTSSPLSLIVSLDRFCPNPGCSFVHRIGALTTEIQGRSEHIDGEVYQVSDEGLEALDKLEHYDPKNTDSSAYIRRKITVHDIKSKKSMNAFIYFIADATKYVDLLYVDRAETVSTYTLEMASGTLKPCCTDNPNHNGDHCVLPFPAISSTKKISQ